MEPGAPAGAKTVHGEKLLPLLPAAATTTMPTSAAAFAARELAFVHGSQDVP
jgi:hypothetical protein